MDPYKVLGVNPGDDEETIKKAYRTLAKKYHPDRYVNTPMADMANEKLKEINEAYDMITNKKTTSSSSGSGAYGSYGSYGGYGGARYSNTYSVSFESVRMLIRMRRFREAEEMLAKLPNNAEWNYLMGVICINRGWYDKGREYINKAVSMDPGNMEYVQTLNSFEHQNNTYRQYHTDFVGCCDPCNCLCSSFICSAICPCC